LVPALAACGVIVALDQGTKALATSLVSRGDRVEVLPFLAFENVRNKGVAFGIGGDISAVLIGATIVLLLGFLVYLAFRGGTGWHVWLPAALLIGGALGNLADRARDGAVTDFIDLPLWPTFNLADVAIVVGANEAAARAWTIRVRITRAGREVFGGSTRIDRIKRPFTQLRDLLFARIIAELRDERQQRIWRLLRERGEEAVLRCPDARLWHSARALH